jgi:arylsulfatase
VWEHEGNRAIRVGDWKLVAKGPRAAWELYDLAKDRTEMNDLASKEPERVKDLAARWDAWARRSNVLPWPWNEEESRTASTRTRFDLDPNANLPRAEAPDYVNRGFTVTVNIATPGTNGVLVAQGGAAHGWALYFDKGAFHFAINRNGNLEDVSTSDAAFAAAKSITAALAADSTLTLSADGREMLKKKVGALPATIPTDGLQVGRDLRGSVGDYATPFAFNGTISGVTLELGPR